MISTELRQKIKKKRQQVGPSQERLAEMVEVPFHQIQKYVNGLTTLNIQKIQLSTKALNHSVTEIFGDIQDDRPRLTFQEVELLQEFRKNKKSGLRSVVHAVVSNFN